MTTPVTILSIIKPVFSKNGVERTIRVIRAVNKVEKRPQLVALDGDDCASDDMIHIRFGAAILELPAKTDAAAIASLLQALQKL